MYCRANTPQDDLDTARDMLLALLRDLKDSGCESVETVRWRNVLIDRILPARTLVISNSNKLIMWQVILMHARECESMGRNCFGEDREEFRVLRQTRERTEVALQMIKEVIANEEAAGDLSIEEE